MSGVKGSGPTSEGREAPANGTTELETKMYRGWAQNVYGGTLFPTSIYRVE